MVSLIVDVGRRQLILLIAEVKVIQKLESEEDFFKRQNIVAIWLYTIIFFVMCTVIIGGLTRLTGSGLSMVDWRPITGWLPPLTDVNWLIIFEEYKKTPEYLIINKGINLQEFKQIFWLEYIHRLWGRIIGLIFILPFIFFLFKGWINSALGIRLLGVFVLGGAQGLMGWYMVQSGLSVSPEVSQYRLAAHFSIALIILASLFWITRGLNESFIPNLHRFNANELITLRRKAYLLLGFVFITACSGAFVAGLDAGEAFNTFPLMDGKLIPDGLFVLVPLYINFFENTLTVQFSHRVLALLTASLIVFFWFGAQRSRIPKSIVLPTHCLLIAVIAQVGLGVGTLLFYVPITLAIAHQSVSVVLFICAVWLARELTPPLIVKAEK